MPRSKKPRLLDAADTHIGSGGSEIVGAATADDLSVNIKAMIFGYFGPVDIMHLRCVCKKWREAAKKTIVPYSSQSNFFVDSVDKYNGMRVMTTALPNLQQLSILYLEDWGHKYSDGEDPDEAEARSTARWNTHDIEIMSSFRKLRSLAIFQANMNGSYPVLFNFPLLQSLDISYCDYLKWDLEMLEGLPSLKELDFKYNDDLTGNINSLRVLKDTLAKVSITYCPYVEGDFMDLADFPHLTTLHLIDTTVTGDIREIVEQDFSALIELSLPNTVYGGVGHELQRISDAPDFISTLYSIKKQRPTLLQRWYGKLSEDSPDWYEGYEDSDDAPPFYIVFVQAGSRVGYRWETENCNNACEVNWLIQSQPKKAVIMKNIFRN